MKQSCFALRPGTIFYYKDEKFRVISNDTLAQSFRAKAESGIKKFTYYAGQELEIRWKPDDRV